VGLKLYHFFDAIESWVRRWPFFAVVIPILILAKVGEKIAEGEQ